MKKSSEGRRQNDKNEVVIKIQLAGGKVPKKIDEEFMKVIQNEYAVRYLELMGLTPTQANIDKILMKSPLSSCEINCTWNTSGWLADVIMIYPNRISKKSFEQ